MAGRAAVASNGPYDLRVALPLRVHHEVTCWRDAFTLLLKQAGIAQEQTVFLGAAVCAVVAGVLAVVLFRGAATRGAAWRLGIIGTPECRLPLAPLMDATKKRVDEVLASLGLLPAKAAE